MIRRRQPARRHRKREDCGEERNNGEEEENFANERDVDEVAQGEDNDDMDVDTAERLAEGPISGDFLVLSEEEYERGSDEEEYERGSDEEEYERGSDEEEEEPDGLSLKKQEKLKDAEWMELPVYDTGDYAFDRICVLALRISDVTNAESWVALTKMVQTMKFAIEAQDYIKPVDIYGAIKHQINRRFGKNSWMQVQHAIAHPNLYNSGFGTYKDGCTYDSGKQS
ncbi:hypothetical protein BT69DRAFT_1377925 [Atractiella rhizophila]|nr:hypothetical protein BT69DRAFT_1377925 [Atractiella rhizophila]